MTVTELDSSYEKNSRDQQIAIVGGIIGIRDFYLEFLPQSMPTVIKLNGHKFALLQHEEFIIGLACRADIPDGFSIICTRNNINSNLDLKVGLDLGVKLT